jgi:hypothetical protein
LVTAPPPVGCGLRHPAAAGWHPLPASPSARQCTRTCHERVSTVLGETLLGFQR